MMQEYVHINSYLHKVKQMLDFGVQGALLVKTMHLWPQHELMAFS